MTPSVLLIEDDRSIAESLKVLLISEGYAVRHEERGDTGLEAAVGGAWDAVLSDLRLPGLGGLDLARKLHQVRPRLPLILMTAHGTSETAIEAMKFGAFDYLIKPPDMNELLGVLAKAVQASRLMTEPVALGSAAQDTSAIIGRSREMQAVYKQIGLVASSAATVLIRGETGTGKELVARALYQHSPRADQPFLAINCAAIPAALLESELFGHEKGSFTSADQRRIGRFEQASGGTLFLDEIGDMGMDTQVKLLRVLQERVVYRVGGKDPIPVDVRIIAATHHNLEEAIQAREFREDLFYRLNVVSITMPALRDRVEDIPELVRYFLARHRPGNDGAIPNMTDDAMRALQSKRWPGNVRELENFIQRTMLLCRASVIDLESIETVLGSSRAPGLAGDPGATTLSGMVSELLVQARNGGETELRSKLMAKVEGELFKQAFAESGGNPSQIARWLGVTRLTCREKLIQFGLIPRPQNDGI